MSGGFRLVSERDVHRGAVFRVSVGTFTGPDGGEFERDLVRHPGAVAVVPLVGADVVLVRQYRPALGAELLEIPAGIRDVDGEALEETAGRELAEEIGMTVFSGVAEKGMPTWSNSLSGEQIVQVTAYVMSLQGTDPPDAKASPSQWPCASAISLAMSEKVAVPLSAATTR